MHNKCALLHCETLEDLKEHLRARTEGNPEITTEGHYRRAPNQKTQIDSVG